MIYAVKQLTTYRYAASVPFARHLLRMTPVSGARQEVMSSSIAIEPEPRERTESDDFFGNRLTHLVLEKPHRMLALASTAMVRVVEAPPPDPAASPAWESVRDAAGLGDLTARSPVHHIFPSRLVPIDGGIRAYAAESFAPERPVLAGGLELAQRIKRDFAYDPTATDVTTPPVEAFALRRGVCQDFAQVMIAGLRGLGLAAAYVSGYLRTNPAPGQARLEGADATHAWVALWCGPELGWQGLDPTNGIPVGSGHIALAFGRDYADVSPIDGVIVASGGHTLSVAVDVVPVGNREAGKDTTG